MARHRFSFLHYSSVLLLSSAAFAQVAPVPSSSAQRLVLGNTDKQLLRPIASHASGYRDQAAVDELEAHLKSTGPWTGMQASGTITYDRGNGVQKSFPAHLSISGTDKYRFDVDEPDRPLSIRISSDTATIRRGTEAPKPLIADSTLAGLFPFARVRQSTLDLRDAIVDYGTVDTDLGPLHKVCLERWIDDGTGVGTTNAGGLVVPVDLYFDSSTHLLRKSAVRLDALAPLSGIVIQTYSDYQSISGVLVPMEIAKSVNGQQLSTLKLDQVTIPASVTGIPENTFLF